MLQNSAKLENYKMPVELISLLLRGGLHHLKWFSWESS